MKTVYFFNGSIFPMGIPPFLQQAWGKHWRAYVREQSCTTSYENAFSVSFSFSLLLFYESYSVKNKREGNSEFQERGKGVVIWFSSGL